MPGLFGTIFCSAPQSVLVKSAAAWHSWELGQESLGKSLNKPPTSHWSCGNMREYPPLLLFTIVVSFSLPPLFLSLPLSSSLFLSLPLSLSLSLSLSLLSIYLSIYLFICVYIYIYNNIYIYIPYTLWNLQTVCFWHIYPNHIIFRSILWNIPRVPPVLLVKSPSLGW